MIKEMGKRFLTCLPGFLLVCAGFYMGGQDWIAGYFAIAIGSSLTLRVLLKGETIPQSTANPDSGH